MNTEQILNDLRTLDLQAPGKWPSWLHVAAAILLSIAIVGLGFYLKLIPMQEQLERLEKEEVGLFKKFEQKQKKVVALDAYKAQLEEMERNFGAMLKQLPSRSEVANLLNDISQTRVASSLDEELFKPEGEQPKDFYAILPNRIIVTGDYHEFGTFVSNVAALPRIVTIDEVKIAPAGQGPRGRGQRNSLSPKLLRMTAMAKTYRYLDDEELAAAEAAAKAKQGRRR